MGVLAGFLILGYYSVVAGWTLEFIGEAATNSFAGKSAADFIASFNSFVSNPWRPVIWLVLFLLATHLIIVKGVEKVLKISQNHDADAVCPIDNPCHLLYISARSRSRY